MESKNKIIEVQDITISPEQFFREHVHPRKPAKLTGYYKDDDWNGVRNWKNSDYLRLKAGNVEVRVEVRTNELDRFGKGNEIKMKFHDFLDKVVRDGNTNYYLTTQELSYSPEGQPSILSPPLTVLRDDFRLHPKIMGNLIPQNINIWMGVSKQSSSSGLHHDFHDNLYLVLKGEKTFRLFPPQEYQNLYTVGEITRVHPNGRINYKDQPTLPDGSAVSSSLALQAAIKLQLAATKLAEAEKKGNVSSDIEDELEEALEASLEAELDDQEEEEDDDDDSNEDDNNELETTIDENDRDDPKLTDEINQSKKRPRLESKPSDPASFSRVPTHLPIESLRLDYPLYVDALSRSYEFTIKEGEMLYLPSGWFHEVFSNSVDSDCHMAINYWFHPPDHHQYDQPYSTNFWSTDWKVRLESGFI